MLGTLIDVTNLTLTASIIVVLLVYRKRLFSIPTDAISPRQYERMTQRIDALELTEVAGMKEAQDFRHNMIEVSHAQLEATRDHNKLLKKLVGEVGYVHRSLDELPCRRDNGKECPEGHEEE